MDSERVQACQYSTVRSKHSRANDSTEVVRASRQVPERVHRAIEHERQLLFDEGHARVGGEAKRRVGKHPANVAGCRWFVLGRAHPSSASGRTLMRMRGAPDDWANPTDEHDWVVEPIELMKARSEVGELDRAAVVGLQRGDEHRGVGEVALAR